MLRFQKGIKKELEYIPRCDCLEKNRAEELEKLEKKRVQEMYEKQAEEVSGYFCKWIKVYKQQV